MSDNVKVLVVGAGTMAKEYCKVLLALHCQPIVVGRGEENAAKFEEEMNIPVLRGGMEKNISKLSELPRCAIVAVGVTELARTTKLLLEHGVKNCLVEKPAGMNRQEMEDVAMLANNKDAKVYVAYNRRFYASTEKALEIIKNDGGVTSFHFEFTEWGHVIEKTAHSSEVKENWFLANSTHVTDLAFFLGGFPKEMHSYVQGELDWHKRGCVYAGAGISERDALFSYQANWAAPGRWSVEILTKEHRLYFKPMEKLLVQEKGSVAVNPIEIDDALDVMYKPGLYRQVESFLQENNDGKKITIQEQLAHMQWYEKIDM